MQTLEQRLDAAREKAKLLFQQGQLEESLAVHEQALDLAPHAVIIRLSAAKLAHAMELQERSLRHFEEAARVDPRCHQAMEAARRICVGAGIEERAAHYSRLAYELNPSAQLKLSMKLLVPAILQSVDAIQEVRARYERGLEELAGSPPQLDKPTGDMGVAAFFLAYHGENDRELQAAAARLYLKAIPSLQFTAPHCLGGRRRGGRGGKIRIGFISRFFASHSIFSTSVGLIEKLSRDKFEVIALRIMPSRDDECTARIRAAADVTVNLDPDSFRARERIAALELDILFYQDIGMEPLSYILAFARLAPVQCVSFGHPNTTGVPTLDYFISNDLFEPPGAQDHYTEKLVQLRDLPTLAYYYKPEVPATRATRESFGLPAAANLYVCPQTLYKLHPEFDELLRGIFARDSHAVIVFIAGQFQEYTNQLRRRFERSLPGAEGRIVFLPFMPFDRFMHLLCLADVILDTVHFNGMNSSLQALAAGTPVVTLPGRFQRGRHTQAMYLKMGVLDCIAESPEHYVEIAVRIATNAAHRAQLHERILSRHHVLFEDPRVVAEFERFFLEAVADVERSAEPAWSAANPAIAKDSQDPAALMVRGSALLSHGRADEALGAFEAARRLDPHNPLPSVKIGRLMIQLNRFDLALDAFDAALERDPRAAAALQGRAQCLAAQSRAPEAVEAYARLLDVAPDADYMRGERFHLQMHCCDWRDFDATREDIAARVRRAERADIPGSFMTHCDSPEDQLRCARIFAADFCPQLEPRRHAGGEHDSGRIRVAYLSADFHEHATSFLAAGLIEAHDRGKFETHAISFGPDDGSPMRTRLIRAFDHFDDVRHLTDEQVANLLQERRIDIAVDLKGHTLGARPWILASRPAPVQVSFLGYPGTSGVDFIDYIVADRIVIPESERVHYAEQVIYLPGSYQVNSARILSAPVTRPMAGLPEAAFVFCCFNSTYKITPAVFDDWMHILRAVPGSVLWLLESSVAATQNLRREARRRGVDEGRLIFAPNLSPADHLARCALADLFLDTAPYNAHTTASDALWSGVPVITRPGTGFASRVATSLLRALGLGQLSVDSREEYRRLAIRIAGSRTELAFFKDALAAARTSSALFDPAAFCRRLERAFEIIVMRNRRGEAASPLDLT